MPARIASPDWPIDLVVTDHHATLDMVRQILNRWIDGDRTIWLVSPDQVQIMIRPRICRMITITSVSAGSEQDGVTANMTYEQLVGA